MNLRIFNDTPHCLKSISHQKWKENSYCTNCKTPFITFCPKPWISFSADTNKALFSYANMKCTAKKRYWFGEHQIEEIKYTSTAHYKCRLALYSATKSSKLSLRRFLSMSASMGATVVHAIATPFYVDISIGDLTDNSYFSHIHCTPFILCLLW